MTTDKCWDHLLPGSTLWNAFSQVGSTPPALCEVASWLSQGKDLGVPSAIVGTGASQLSQG